jgi:hypothetical protein
MQVAESQRCGGMGVPFRVVQPWGPDKVQQKYDAERASDSGRCIRGNRLKAQMARTGAPTDAIELVVVDVERHIIVGRWGTH